MQPQRGTQCLHLLRTVKEKIELKAAADVIVRGGLEYVWLQEKAWS